MAVDNPTVMNTQNGAIPLPGLQLPTAVANRFYLSIQNDVGRLVFGEVVGGNQPHWHAAHALAISDLEELSACITGMIAAHKKALGL